MKQDVSPKMAVNGDRKASQPPNLVVSTNIENSQNSKSCFNQNIFPRIETIDPRLTRNYSEACLAFYETVSAVNLDSFFGLSS